MGSDLGETSLVTLGIFHYEITINVRLVFINETNTASGDKRTKEYR